MAQWIKLLWNNSFVNWTWLANFLGEKSGAIALVLLGLMAGRQNSAQFRNFQNYVLDKIFEFLLRLTKVQCVIIIVPMHFSGFFM